MNIRAYVAAFTATFAVVFAAEWWTRAWYLAAVPFAGYVLSWADHAVNFQFAEPRDCVYYLFNSDRRLIYVGESNDVQRRALEHTNRGSADHKPAAKYVQVARYCRSNRQAQRIEARRIRALTFAHRHAFTGPLLNETWAAPTRNPVRRAAVAVWMVAYWCESWLHPDRRWGARNLTAVPIPEDREPDDSDRWDPPEGPYDAPSDDTADTVTEATYTRHLTMIALPPVRSSASADASADTSPPLRSRGSSPTRTQADADSDPVDELARRRARDAERKRRARQKQRQGDK